MIQIPNPKKVDDYIEQAPKDVQNKLRRIREIIRKAAPSAEERISYGMPYYNYKGRLAYFGAFKDHISLFAMPPIVGEHKRELRKYKTGKATIQFPVDQRLPISMIRKFVKAGVRKNEAKKKTK